jgi:hypothetical protein
MTYVLVFIGLFVLSVVILIVSMFIASAVAGGIDFGSVSGVLLKAIPLLLVVTGLSFVPYGNWIAIPVWWFGLMALFHLDFWEVRILVVVNWLLNLLAHVALIAALR